MRRLNSRAALWLWGIRVLLLQGVAAAQFVHSPVESGNIRQSLKPDEVMLEYVLTDSLAQLNVFATDSMMNTTQTLNALFWSSLESFRKKLKSADPDEFSILGQVLYLYLVKPVEDFLSGRHRLIIIPGNRLAGLPFEAFVVSDNSPPPYNVCNIHYLVRDFEIVYHCSVAAWLDDVTPVADERSAAPDYQVAFMGFSPVFNDYRSLSALPGSKIEIARIGSMFQEKGLSEWLSSGQCSDKEYFKAVADRGKIIHLATHYVRDATDPRREGFLFWGYDPSGKVRSPEEGVLSTEEIARLHLKADLIVLNACSAGSATAGSGDTTATVPCIFYLAGARNVLSALWNVNDDLAGKFMICFYRRWFSGKNYSESLRDVKLEMLRYPETALPTLWAPYVLTGR